MLVSKSPQLHQNVATAFLCNKCCMGSQIDEMIFNSSFHILFNFGVQWT